MKLTQAMRTLIIFVILISNISCDHISKNVIRERFEYHEQLSFLNNHLIITKIENSGAFFSLGNNLPQPLKVILLSFIPLVVIGFAFGYLLIKKSLSNQTALGICFIVGGGVGNIYDRIMFGSVTDFLHIDFGLFRTGIFNMADVSIMIGVITIFAESYFKRKKLQGQEALDDRQDEPTKL